MDKINSLYNKFLRNFSGGGNSKIPTQFYGMFEFIMPLLLGISIGWLGTISIDYVLSPRSAALQLNMAASMAAAQGRVDSDNELDAFLSANPFSISAFPVAVSNVPVEAPRREEVTVEVKNSFTTATLSGTFPDIGAWLKDNTNNEVNYIPIGENFDAYQLTEVLYDRAVFQDAEKNNITKFLYLVEITTGNTVASTPAPAPAPTPQPVADQFITAAVANGQEGALDRAVVNELLMNPFDEMKKFRIRPKFDGYESIGLEIQWIQNDSLLGKLGVLKNDVVKSVNGIPMKNMGDIANAINSLMNGSRFDVEVVRGNAPINLTYVVR